MPKIVIARRFLPKQSPHAITEFVSDSHDLRRWAQKIMWIILKENQLLIHLPFFNPVHPVILSKKFVPSMKSAVEVSNDNHQLQCRSHERSASHSGVGLK